MNDAIKILKECGLLTHELCEKNKDNGYIADVDRITFAMDYYLIEFKQKVIGIIEDEIIKCDENCNPYDIMNILRLINQL